MEPHKQTVTAGGTAMIKYVVQRGDTLSIIAARFGTSVDAIARANGIRNPDMIYKGQILRIPTAYYDDNNYNNNHHKYYNNNNYHPKYYNNYNNDNNHHHKHKHYHDTCKCDD
jgi:LysM repeat protein